MDGASVWRRTGRAVAASPAGALQSRHMRLSSVTAPLMRHVHLSLQRDKANTRILHTAAMQLQERDATTLQIFQASTKLLPVLLCRLRESLLPQLRTAEQIRCPLAITAVVCRRRPLGARCSPCGKCGNGCCCRRCSHRCRRLCITGPARV